jgi:Legionella pneumophila major outer membrane protein precursor
MSYTHLPQLRRRLLSASSYFCLALVLTESTLVEAADVGLRPAFVGKAAPYQDRGFISVEGGYWFNGSESSLAFDRGDELVSLLGPTRPGRNGWTAAIAFGRTFGPQWDWAVAYRYTTLKTNSVAGSSFTEFGPPFVGTETVNASASNRLWYQHLDLELGYRPPEWQSAGLRLFVGPRILNARQRMQYDYSGLSTVDFDGFAAFSKLGTFDHDVNLWGVGPRAGLQASVPLAQTPWSINASGSASMIFSRVNHQHTFNFAQELFFSPDAIGSGTISSRTWRTVYNLEGSVALGYQLGNAAQLQVGYQVQQWWSLATRITTADSQGRLQVGPSDVLTHGPFGKITVALP